jgi:GT2 family glycosyltransferase
MAVTPLVSVIIVNYNAGKLLLNCVESVFLSNNENYEVIIVDNCSSDNSHKECKKKFDRIKLIENSENLGYCEGNNVGIRNASGDYLLILNPDTVIESDLIEKFLETIKNYGEGLFQGKNVAIDNDNILRSTGNWINIFGFGYARDKGTKESKEFFNVEEINYASGTCLFTSTKTMKKIGLFDSFLFLYHDDLDLGWRASCLNIKSFFVPTIKIRHVSSYNLKWSSQKFFWLERNRKYCLLTHYSESTRNKIRLEIFFVDVMVFFSYLLKGMIKAKILADIDIFRNKKVIEKKYQELEKIKIIPDKLIIKQFSTTIFIPDDVSKELAGKIFNKILGYISNKAKKRLLSS